jgi:peptide/nickel transport system substrate-binding protein
LAAAVLACSNPSPSPTAEPTRSGESDQFRGGTLRVAMDIVGYEFFQKDVQEDPPRFDSVWDPSRTWAADPFELFRCCLLRTLMSYNGLSTSEGGAELQPDVALDHPVISDGGLTWTFRLKQGLHYAPPMADRTIEAADFIRGLERTLRLDPFGAPDDPHAFGPYAQYFQEVIAGAEEFGSGRVSSISGLEAPDAHTLVIHLTKPAGDLGARLAMGAAAPLPPGAADGHDGDYGRYLVASGPYMIEGSANLDPTLPSHQQPAVSGYVPETSLTLVRNPSWDPTTDGLRAAYAERIEIIHMDDYQEVLEAILHDEIDLSLGMDLDPADIDRLRSDSAVAPRIHVSPALTTIWITMNLAAPPFDDVHVRRALNLATNKRALVELMDPGGRVQSHAIPDAFENGLLSDYAPYGTVDDAGSIERAKAAMMQSRYDVDGDGVCDQPACEQIHVGVREDFPERVLAAESLATQLAQIGVGLEVERVTPDEFFGSLSSHPPLVFIFGWNSDYLNASSWFGPLATKAALGAEVDANGSLIGADADFITALGFEITDVPNLDDRIDECVAQVGAAQFECWAQVDQYLMERVVPWIPLYDRQSSRLTSPSVTRFSFDASITMPALDRIAVTHDP